jgi:arsenate reductase (glutaredoxin)
MTVTIYHNPECGTSRNTLAMIRQSGEEPRVIEYLKNPPSRARLGDPKWSDDELLDFMMAHPILINRPIVVTDKGARLCRPSEAILDLLPNLNIGRFIKEDGEVVG